MTRLGTSFVFILTLAIFLGGGGCLPSSQRVSDEQKEPHFLAGKARANGLDYKGAMEAFEKALEVNPRNASAHFELALLCEKEETDLPGAIYHFDRFLRLRPTAENADIVKDRLLRCKQLLAGGVLPVAPAPSLQRELEQLAADNRDLRQKLEAWQAYYASRPQPAATAAGAAPVPVPLGSSATAAPSGPTTPPAQAATAGQAGSSRAPAVSTTRKHIIQAGDSPYSIARKYGVKLDALLAANPDIEPKRLKIGQTLTIPAP